MAGAALAASAGGAASVVGALGSSGLAAVSAMANGTTANAAATQRSLADTIGFADPFFMLAKYNSTPEGQTPSRNKGCCPLSIQLL